MSSNAVTIRAIKAAAEARIPAMIVGAPGVGKTATIRSLAETMEYDLITLIGSQMDPTDITGLPKGEEVAKDAEGNSIFGTVYLAPWWQVRIMQKKKVFLFLDEFSNTSSAVRASLLTLLQNREFPNGETMPEETIVIGAMNPTVDAADGWNLDKPTTNRIMFLTWKTSDSEWAEGMLDAWGKEVSKEEMYWRKAIVGFLRDNPSYIHRENSEEVGTPEALDVQVNDASAAEVLRYAWASRRSWDNLSKILGRTNADDIALQDEISSGTVGRASAIAFREWLIKNTVVDPRDVIKNPKTVDWTTIDVSDANIILKGIVELIDEKNWEKVLEVLDVIHEADQKNLAATYIAQIVEKIMASTRPLGKVAEVRDRMSKTLINYRMNKS